VRAPSVIPPRAALYAAALALLVASGVAHGFWSGRWSRSRALVGRVAALRNVPPKVGEWVGEDSELDRRTLEHADIAGYVLRRYRNPRDGAAATVLLVCGRPGPIAVHTPEACYGGIGYEAQGPRERHQVPAGGGAPGEVWSVVMGKSGPLGSERLKILYAWTADGTWHASAAPRVDFAGAPALYKLYVVYPVAAAGEGPPLEEAHRQFLAQLLPALRDALFPRPAA
jgi:hypothetical protein